MTLDEEAKVAAGPSSLFCSGTGISGLSKEQLDLLLETFESNPNPSAEQTSELAEKLKLTTGQVQLLFLNQRKRKERLDVRNKKMEALTLELGCLLQGIVTPELQRRLQQDEGIRMLQDEIKVMEQENEQLIPIKLLEDKVKKLEQKYEQLIASRASLLRPSERENMAGEVQLQPPPTPGPCCDTGTPSDRMRKRASENSSEQGEKNARRRD